MRGLSTAFCYFDKRFTIPVFLCTCELMLSLSLSFVCLDARRIVASKTFLPSKRHIRNLGNWGDRKMWVILQGDLEKMATLSKLHHLRKNDASLWRSSDEFPIMVKKDEEFLFLLLFLCIKTTEWGKFKAIS